MKEFFMGLGLVFGVMLVAAPLLVIQSTMESATYNRLTGAHTTAWDAFWVDLRVTDCPAKN